ncbi:MAG: thioredoxin domain-containing protein [Hyphomicrobiaceae bacterium]
MSDPHMRGANRLTGETSPYLLQHKDNPVDWWPWGEAALQEARRTGKPILLSVGYAACHWCHVMAHESFEDEETAALMNSLFVNIKVDREERPDIDAIYMAALHTLGEQGGWPLTMFLTSDGEPFWGGTYFPREARYGRPSFRQVLNEIARIHAEEPERVHGNARAILSRLSAEAAPGRDRLPGDAEIAALGERAAGLVDPVHGGMRGAPKFPQHPFLWWLWRAGLAYDLAPAREAVIRTLDNICQGGIYDHVGGGFARYSVDERWLVPHFEKMLYDNALLIDLMTEVWKETGSALLERRIAETAEFMVTAMAAPDGGLASSYDADSEGEEGRFYVWTPAEILDVLGAEDGAFYCRMMDITEGGNFEGRSIPNRLAMPELRDEASERRLDRLNLRLRAHRAGRVPPGFDDKVLADWNGLAIVGLVKAGLAFDRDDWIGAGKQAYRFVMTQMMREGRLVHAYRAGIAKAPATSSDYANMIAAAIALHEATGDRNLLSEAMGLAETLERHYRVAPAGGYALSADDTPGLVVRTRSAHDDAVPNANAVMVANLVRLALLTGEADYEARAEAVLKAHAGGLAEAPLAYCGLLAGLMDAIAPAHLVIVRGEGDDGAGDRLVAAARRMAYPGALVSVFDDPSDIPEGSPAAGKPAEDGRTSAYLCFQRSCVPARFTEAALLELVREARARRLRFTG